MVPLPVQEDRSVGTDGPLSADAPRRRARVRRKAPRGPRLQRLLRKRKARLAAAGLAVLALAGWFFAPAWQGSGSRGSAASPTQPSVTSLAGDGGSGPQVITAFVEDPMRSQAAVLLWRQRPGALLVLQGNAEYQAITYRHLRNRQLWPNDTSRVVRLLPACDTVGLVTQLARLLEKQPTPGQLTIVTAPTHLQRTMAIARIVYAGTGWRVYGAEAETGDLRPEAELRLRRDQLRASLWRLTGWDGRLDANDCV